MLGPFCVMACIAQWPEQSQTDLGLKHGQLQYTNDLVVKIIAEYTWVYYAPSA